MKSPTDVVSGLILLGLCAVGAYSVSLLPAAGSTENVGPGGVPRAVLVILAVLSCILIVKGLRQMPDKRYWPEPRVFKKVLCFLGLIYLYLITLTGLGDLFAAMENPPFASGGAFCISTCLFLLIALPLLGRRKPVEVLLVAVLTTAVLLAAFGWFFQIMLP
ncbi:tripartite tricarboxylate transporter TctB family protein [Desulfovibrio sp. PG-178-WT-4]|uniref:Tripartite tricarboxylate transporter TctB family protein n=1 Tax=Desulfovibrio porci TaxID=2605782 RepID=A0A6L5XIE1_9BACT|nr:MULTISPECIES: tripartite tricarboxylate transporter TctB family protein [Desulfovibrio]MBS6828839.1 tripartite tricarboxylate transporter TctB family protein [Desulfovibrio sp.]MSS26887.1 tripartite tricarboxylate transporter TctB family protein [Desulfovibrio porci]